MDFVDLPKQLGMSFDISLILAVGLMMWKFIEYFTSCPFLRAEAYAGSSGSQTSALQNRSQPIYPRQTLVQEMSQEISQEVPQEQPQKVPQEQPQEVPQEVPRGVQCTLNDLQLLNAAVRCTSANGKHRSPLQPSGSRCVCTKCGEGMYPSNPSP